MNKTKKYAVTTIIVFVSVFLIVNGVSNLLDYSGKLGSFFAKKTENYLIMYPAQAQVLVSRPEPELEMREWVLNYVEEAGLDSREADTIITCESRWNPDTHNVNWETKRGVDRGLWQISSLFHKEVSNQCAYDYKCSTIEAVRIYKEWNSWNAWSCNRLLN